MNGQREKFLGKKASKWLTVLGHHFLKSVLKQKKTLKRYHVPVMIVVYVCHKPTSMFTLNSQTMFFTHAPYVTDGVYVWGIQLGHVFLYNYENLSKNTSINFHGNEH